MGNNSSEKGQQVTVIHAVPKPHPAETVNIRSRRGVQEMKTVIKNSTQQVAGSPESLASLPFSASENANSAHQSSQTKRKKRRSKAEMEELRKMLLILLKAGCSLSSAPHISLVKGRTI